MNTNVRKGETPFAQSVEILEKELFDTEYGPCYLFAIRPKQGTLEYTHAAVMDDICMYFRSEPSLIMIEDEYLTVMADRIIMNREKEIRDAVSDIEESDRKIREMMELGFTEDQAEMCIGMMHQAFLFNPAQALETEHSAPEFY